VLRAKSQGREELEDGDDGREYGFFAVVLTELSEVAVAALTVPSAKKVNGYEM